MNPTCSVLLQESVLIDQLGYVLNMTSTTSQARHDLAFLRDFVAAQHAEAAFPANFVRQVKQLHLVVCVTPAYDAMEDTLETCAAVDAVKLAVPTSLIGLLLRFSVGQRLVAEAAAAVDSQRAEVAVLDKIDAFLSQLEMHDYLPLSAIELQAIDGWLHTFPDSIKTRFNEAEAFKERRHKLEDNISSVLFSLMQSTVEVWPSAFVFAGHRELSDHARPRMSHDVRQTRFCVRHSLIAYSRGLPSS